MQIELTSLAVWIITLMQLKETDIELGHQAHSLFLIVLKAHVNLPCKYKLYSSVHCICLEKEY